MKELLENLLNPCPPKPGGGITITIDLDLKELCNPTPPIDDIMKKKMMMKSLEGEEEPCPLEAMKKLSPEMPAGGQTISFMGDDTGKNKTYPEIASDSPIKDFEEIFKNLESKCPSDGELETDVISICPAPSF